MKKLSYSEVSLYFHRGEGSCKTDTFTGEEAQAVASQILAHEDIRSHVGDNNELTSIVKWDSVIMATLVRAVEEVAAPHDDICDGYCDKKGLNIELKDISSKCYTLDGANLASMSFVVGGETITVPALDGDVSGLIKAKTYDCEAVNAEIAYEMALSEGTATLTITATYNGDTVTKAISAETECA